MSCWPRDHPRVCGEHYTLRFGMACALGSSPRMRGTRFRQLEVRRRPGIIPAYAGNTSLLTRFSSMSQDHPRVCGEHTHDRFSLTGLQGSSPRMRGTRARQAAVARERGIIPAYAGNTMRSRTAWPTIRDHPRVCGEHPDPIVLSCAIWGSSPRMRGTLMRFPSRSARCGIIPAYAGNTCLRVDK